MALKEIPVKDVVGGRNIRLNATSVAELAASVREFGILNPITVQELPYGKYEVVTGNRRLEAAKAVGLQTIPAVIRNADESRRILEQLTENIQRQNLTPLEEAAAFARYLEVTGERRAQLARRLGKSSTYVWRILSVNRLTEEEENAVRSMKKQPAKDTLTMAATTKDLGHRKALLTGETTPLRVKKARTEENPRFKERSKNFGMNVELSRATVTLLFRKKNVPRSEVIKALELARSAVANMKRWPLG